jgi:transcriptional regulator with XRE-family HTH domain/tetratricopeptide (TPR) repeat protein
MPRNVAPPLSRALTALRSKRGLTQDELGTLAGTTGKVISHLETGYKPLTREKLDRYAALLGFDREDVEVALAWLEPPEEDAAPRSPVDPTPAERRRIEAGAQAVGRGTAEIARAEMIREVREVKARRDREEAEARWAELAGLTPEARRQRVETDEACRTWAVCERLCVASEKAAADNAAKALELAELAQVVAARAPVDENWRHFLLGYSKAHGSNAQRVGCDLNAARCLFSEALRLWQSDRKSDPYPLSRGRMLDLEASLCRDERRFVEALDLLDRALHCALGDEEKGRILLKRSAVLEQRGEEDDFLQAAEALREVKKLITGVGHDPRQMFGLHFNTAILYCHAGLYEQAEALLPEIRSMAVALRNELDLVRVLWLQARIDSHFCRRGKALAALVQVLEEFTQRKMGYDAALSSMELAVLFLEEGKTREVKRLASDLERIFRLNGIHREALAALQLFRLAVERETATAALAKRVVAFLYHARHDPQLRFDERADGE